MLSTFLADDGYSCLHLMMDTINLPLGEKKFLTDASFARGSVKTSDFFFDHSILDEQQKHALFRQTLSVFVFTFPLYLFLLLLLVSISWNASSQIATILEMAVDMHGSFLHSFFFLIFLCPSFVRFLFSRK